jgi:hypothetical protein
LTELFDLRTIQATVDEVPAGGSQLEFVCQPHVGSVTGYSFGGQVRLPGGRIDINFPKSHVVASLPPEGV